MIVSCGDKGGITIYEIMENRRAVSELSPIADINSLKKVYPAAEGSWAYFSRLFVPKDYPDRSVCFRLMKATVNWADNEKISIMDEINPYNNDRLNIEQLIIFNKLYGFKPVTSNIMVRICK